MIIKYKSNFITLSVLVIVSLLPGCASVPLAAIENDRNAKLFSPVVNNAIIYVYRKSSAYGAAITYPIIVDGKKLGELASGTFVKYEVTEGEHDLWAVGGDSWKSLNKKFIYPLHANAGQIYIFELTASTARSPKIVPIDQPKGMEAVKKCKLIKLEDFKGPALK